MKYIAILLMVLSSCARKVEVEGRIETKDNYSVIVIDECEYIEVDIGIFDQRVYSLTHKGNCKNHLK